MTQNVTAQFVTVKSLDSKLERLERSHRTKLKDVHRDSRASYAKRLEAPLKDVLPLIWRSRTRLFVNYKSSCTWDPATGEGRSYNWYSLSRVIKGQLVLNGYSYSSCTCKHRNALGKLFDLLKLPYVTIESPQGLQDGPGALRYALETWAQASIAETHARSKYPKHVQAKLERLKLTAKLYGLRVPSLKRALKAAELERTERLAQARGRAALKREHDRAQTPEFSASAPKLESVSNVVQLRGVS